MLPNRFVIMSMVFLLAGIATARPSAFAEGEGFEPPMFPFRAVTLHFAIVASALAASLSFSFGYLSANLPCRWSFALLLHSNLDSLVKSHHSASQLHNFARCNHSLYLVLGIC